MASVKARKLVLASGSEFYGEGFGAERDSVCEVVFNTSMAGYQEIVSDPSYTDQAVCMTYPIIGNYGITDEDYETKTPTIGALIVRDYNDNPSNFRYTKTLGELMQEYNIPGLSGIDTRRLTREIRSEGSQKGLLCAADTPIEWAMEVLGSTEIPHDQVSRVSCKKRWYSRTSNHRYTVVALDCGIKLGMVKALNARGCNVTVVPWNTTAEEIDFMRPDGILLSNGPGDPTDVPGVVETVRALKGRYPIMGICLGHQVLALAHGAKTYKLKFGHRGGNHPVRELATGHIEMTSQNHSYAVDPGSLAGTGLEITHINLLDNTVEGMKSADGTIFSVQYHPESKPGPQDSAHLFDRFVNMLGKEKKNA